MDPDCLFCRIAVGTEAAYVMWESRDVVAFLDTRPVFKGHTLIVPRLHIGNFTDLPDDLVMAYFTAARRIAAAMTTALGAQGSFVAMNNVVSQSVPHLHIHVVPRTKGDGLRGFFWPRTKYADEAEAQSYVERLRGALAD